MSLQPANLEFCNELCAVEQLPCALVLHRTFFGMHKYVTSMLALPKIQ